MTDTFCRETLQEHTVDQLRNWARILRIKIPGYVKKQDLIQKIIDATHIPRAIAESKVAALKRKASDESGPRPKRSRVHIKPGLTTLQAVQRIQRFFRRHVRGFINHEDFMTLDPFTTGPVFRHVVELNQVYRFHPLHLWRYFQEAGLLRNPYTQADFNPVELKRLQKLLKRVDPQFSCDLLAERDELRRKALEAINLEHNIQFYYDHLHDTVIGGLQQSMHDGTAFDMTSYDLFVFVEMWSRQEILVNQYLYTLMQLSRTRAMAFIYDIINTRFIVGMNLDYTLQFRLYVNLVITTVENLFLYFSALGPQEQPFLFAHNIWNTVIHQTLQHEALAPAVVPVVEQPIAQQLQPAAIIQAVPIMAPLEYEQEEDDSEDLSTEEEDDDDE